MYRRRWPSEPAENNFARMLWSIGWHWLSERPVRCYHVETSTRAEPVFVPARTRARHKEMVTALAPFARFKAIQSRVNLERSPRFPLTQPATRWTTAFGQSYFPRFRRPPKTVHHPPGG